VAPEERKNKGEKDKFTDFPRIRVNKASDNSIIDIPMTATWRSSPFSLPKAGLEKVLKSQDLLAEHEYLPGGPGVTFTHVDQVNLDRVGPHIEIERVRYVWNPDIPGKKGWKGAYVEVTA